MRAIMISCLATLPRLFFQIFRSKATILSENAMLKKENDILLRRVGKKRVHFSKYGKRRNGAEIMKPC